MERLIALVTLTVMEIVLGIDNVIFIAIVAARLPKEQQPRARRLGLMVALITRLLLLGLLFVLAGMEDPFFSWTQIGLPESWFTIQKDGKSVINDVTNGVSVKDLVLFVGGAFLIGKSTMEIHHKLEGHEEGDQAAGGKPAVSFTNVIIQIAILDVVFSLDSVITAVGMVQADHKGAGGTDWVAIGIMVTAMIIALGVMLLAATWISDFVAKHPTVKILALAFLILIGVMLAADGIGHHIPKGYVYFAMAFSVAVEMVNMRVRKAEPVKLHEKEMPKVPAVSGQLEKDALEVGKPPQS